MWEFALGMVIAQSYYKTDFINLPNKAILLLSSTIGLTISGVTGMLGGTFKIINDIPSLIGYGAIAVLLFSLKVKYINNIFLAINKFSYEWYLVHILIFTCTFRIMGGILPEIIVGLFAFVFSIIVAKIYNLIIISQYYLKTKIIKYE
jgi:peptidoglycan/LPS O-acetylase OafA/YrhL